MKGNVAPHLIWAITVLAALGMLLFFIGSVLTQKGEAADELITLLKNTLEKDVQITITVNEEASE